MWDVIKTAGNDWLRHHDARLGAALAYYSVFSLGPLLLIVVSIAGVFFGADAVRDALTGQFRSLLGPVGSQAVEAMLKGASSPASGKIAGAVGVILLLVAALGVVVQLKDALNTIWETKQPESAGVWWYLRTYSLLAEAQCVLQVEAPDVGAPELVQVRRAGSGPPQPEHLRWVRPSRQAADLDQDDGAAHDRPGLAAAATGMVLLLGVQPRPGAHAHRAVLLVLSDVLGGRRRPRRRVLAGELGPMFARDGRPLAMASLVAGRRRSSGRHATGRGWPPGSSAKACVSCAES